MVSFQETGILELDLLLNSYELFATAGKMTIYKLKQVKVITVQPRIEIDALFEVLEQIQSVQVRMQHIVLIYECNLSVWNIYSEVENKLSDLKVVT